MALNAVEDVQARPPANEAGLSWLAGRMSRVAGLITVLLWAGATAQAQPVAGVGPVATKDGLTFTQLIDLTMASNPTLAARLLDKKAAALGVNAARMQFFPTPSFQTDGLGGQYATIVRLSQPIWTGGKLTADLSAAKLREERSSADVADSALTLALKVATLYQSYWVYAGRSQANEKNLQRLGELAGMMTRRQEAGVSAQIDLDLVNSRLAQGRADLLASNAGRQTSLDQLSQTVGRKVEANELSLLDPPFQPMTLEDALSGVATHPAMRRARIDERIVQNEIAIARAALYPTISVRMEYQRGAYLGSQTPGSRVYLSLQQSLGGGGLSSITMIEAAQVRQSSAVQASEGVRRDLIDVSTADWIAFQADQARWPELRATRKTSGDVLDSSRRLFVTGRRTWLDLLNSVREQTTNDQMESEARVAVIADQYKLRLRAGLPLPGADRP